MTGYQSKKAAALDEEGMYLVHQTAQLKAAGLPDTPTARAYLKKVLDEDDDIQVYKKPWVGLTDAEKDGKRVLENGLLFNAAEVQAWELGVDYAESKLKERNA